MAGVVSAEWGTASLFQRLAVPLGVEHTHIVAAWQASPRNWTVIYDRDPDGYKTNAPALKARVTERPSGRLELVGEPVELVDFWSELAGKLRHVSRAFPWDQSSSS